MVGKGRGDIIFEFWMGEASYYEVVDWEREAENQLNYFKNKLAHRYEKLLELLESEKQRAKRHQKLLRRRIQFNYGEIQVERVVLIECVFRRAIISPKDAIYSARWLDRVLMTRGNYAEQLIGVVSKLARLIPILSHNQNENMSIFFYWLFRKFNPNIDKKSGKKRRWDEKRESVNSKMVKLL